MRRPRARRAFFISLFGMGAIYAAAGAWVFTVSGRSVLLVIGGAVLALTWIAERRDRKHPES